MPFDLPAERHVLLVAFIALEWIIRIAMVVIVPFRRSPDAAKGWLLLILFEPILGLALYLVFGRRRLPAWRLKRATAFRELAHPIRARLLSHPNVFHPAQDPSIAPGIQLAEKLGEMPILGGNSVEVLSDYTGIFDRLVADIDAARSHVHLLFYIIADDAVAGRVIAALERAAARGVACRVLADALGSRGVRFVATAAQAARCRHRSLRDHARGLLPAARRAHGSAQPPQDRGDRRPHRLHGLAQPRRPQFQARPHLRGADGAGDGPGRARAAGGVRAGLVSRNRNADRDGHIPFPIPRSPAPCRRRCCRRARSSRGRTISG